VRMEGLEPPRD